MRIAPRPPRACPWYLRPFFWNQRRKYGRVLDSALLWARSPKLFLAVALLYGAIDRRSSPLAPALRSLLTVRVSQINHCRFCVDLNSATLLRRGLSEEKLWALEDWRASNLFDDRERAALDYAEAVTRSDLAVDDALMTRLRAHFDEDAIVELTALVAFQNMSSKFNAALDVPPQGFCRVTPGKSSPNSGRSRRAAVTRKSQTARRGGTVMRRTLPGLAAFAIGSALAWLTQAPSAMAQPERYWGPDMMWGGWFHMFFGFLMMLLFLGILVGLVVFVVRWLGSEHSPLRQAGPGARSPLDTLKERLARGEIDVAEYEERRRALGE